MNCIYCESTMVVRNGKGKSVDEFIQRYLCNECGRRFNERSETPIANLQTPVDIFSLAMKMRGEGLGIRATARVVRVAPNSVINWEECVSSFLTKWSPPAPERGDITIEGDEVYTRVVENLPPEKCEGWTIHFIERETRYWIEAQAGLKNANLFENSVKSAWKWAESSEYIRWFTDGERRYGIELWKLASVYIRPDETTESYRYCKVWKWR
jgi:transposase-like protein